MFSSWNSNTTFHEQGMHPSPKRNATVNWKKLILDSIYCIRPGLENTIQLNISFFIQAGLFNFFLRLVKISRRCTSYKKCGKFQFFKDSTLVRRTLGFESSTKNIAYSFVEKYQKMIGYLIRFLYVSVFLYTSFKMVVPWCFSILTVVVISYLSQKF